MSLPASQLILSGINDFESGINQLASQFISDKEEENKIWAQKTFSEFAVKSTEYNEESKINYQSPDMSGFAESQSKWYDETTSKIIKDAPSESAALKLQDSFTKYRERYVGRSVLFEAERKAQYYDVQAQQTVDNLSNASYLNPSDAELLYNQGITDIDTNKYLPGHRKEQLKQDISNGIFIGKNKGLQRNVIDRFNNKEISANQALTLLDEINSGLSDSTFTSAVDSNVLIGITDGIKNENKSFKTSIINKEKSAIQSEFVDHISSIEETGHGVIDPNRISDFVKISDDPAFVTEIIEKENTARQLYETKKGILQDPQNSSQYLASLKPTPGEKEFDFKMKAYNAASAFANKVYDNIENDPVSLLSSDETVISAAQADSQSKVKTNTILALYSQQVERFKTPPGTVKFLTENDAKQLVRELNNLPPDQIESRLEELEQQYDVNLPTGSKAYNNVYTQLAKEGLDGGIRTISANKGEPWVDDLINARKIGYKTLVAALPTEVKVSDLDVNIESRLVEFKQGITLIGGTRSTDFVDIKNSIKLLSMQYINRGVANQSEAITKAYQNVIGNKYEIIKDENYGEARILIPKKINGRRIDTNQVKKELFFRNSDYFINKFIGDGKLYLGEMTGTMSEEAKRNFSVSNISKNGFWYTDPSGTSASYYIRMAGVTQPIPLKVRTKDGKIKSYRLNFDRIHESQSYVDNIDNYKKQGGKILKTTSGLELNPNNYNDWRNSKLSDKKSEVPFSINLNLPTFTLPDFSETKRNVDGALKNIGKVFDNSSQKSKPPRTKIINGGTYVYNEETGEYE